jgi:hypothetical protein
MVVIHFWWKQNQQILLSHLMVTNPVTGQSKQFWVYEMSRCSIQQITNWATDGHLKRKLASEIYQK